MTILDEFLNSEEAKYFNTQVVLFFLIVDVTGTVCFRYH
jgi:hypothetical protein